MAAPGGFYVYRYIDPVKNEVFYIGKGKGDRAYKHLDAAHGNKKSYFLNRIRQIKAQGLLPEIEILFENLNESAALKKEIEFIGIYGRKILNTGTLCNITSGGEGCVLPKNVLALRNAAISKGLIGRKRNPLSVAKMADTKRKWFKNNPDKAKTIIQRLEFERNRVENEQKRIEKVRQAHTGKKWSPEARAKLSQSCKGRVYSADIISKMAATKRKIVYCSNGQVYSCMLDAAQKTGLSKTSIWRACNGKYKSIKGLCFSYERT